MSNYFDNLIVELQKLPSIGQKTAERLALFILKQNKINANFSKQLGEAILNSNKVTYCKSCFNFCSSDSENNLCSICSDYKRDTSIICIVSDTKDLLAIEKTNEYRGLYHVLQGLISPMEGISPKDIRIKELNNRLKDNTEIKEVLLALDSNIESQTTYLYLEKNIPKQFKLSRIAFGLSLSTGIEYADPTTLAIAIKERKIIND